ncbi:unnamed protein product [Sphagnum troendelagicum]|uniref:F-box domain-containing protein n=1 Tax=Sphagnum troendelagicum TaxID=128251 RepID=A0ABP0TIJ5_9BRYO
MGDVIEQAEIGPGDEELDAALEMELATSFLKHPSVSLPPDAGHGTMDVTGEAVSRDGSSQLTFAFPGWGVDISRDAKRKNPSIFRHASDVCSIPSNFKANKSITKERGWETPEYDGEGSPVDFLDDELLVFVFKHLDMKDLCVTMQVCKRWHSVGSHDQVWEAFPLSTNAPKVLPRWIQVRNGILAKSLGQRFGVFLKGYDYVRHAISAWWDSGKPCSKFTSTLFRSLIQKLTVSDWSLLYEAFGAAFSDRADHMASALLAQIENTRSVHIVDESQVCQSTGDQIFLVGMPGIPLEDSAVEAQQHRSSVSKWRAWNSNWRKSVDELEFQELWQNVCTLWMRYKRWLMLIVSHCPELNHEVMAERARGYAFAATPTVYEKGVICFRSQVVLKYGLRSILQSVFHGLIDASANESASDTEIDLLRSLFHLLQELDVPDDLTLPHRSFTRQKLRRCFRNDVSFTRLHTPENKKRLRPSHIPPS